MKRFVFQLLIFVPLSAFVVFGYLRALDALTAPYLMHLTELTANAEKKEAMEKQIGRDLEPDEKSALIEATFPATPSVEQASIQKHLGLSMKKFSVWAFAFLTLGACANLIFGKKPGTIHILVHVFGLTAGAFALPCLLFKDQALRLLGPLCVIFSTLFFLFAIVRAMQQRNNQKSVPG